MSTTTTHQSQAPQHRTWCDPADCRMYEGDTETTHERTWRIPGLAGYAVNLFESDGTEGAPGTLRADLDISTAALGPDGLRALAAALVEAAQVMERAR